MLALFFTLRKAMPELPEVETLVNGLKPHLKNKRVKKVIVRERRLRWPVPQNLAQALKNQNLLALQRRAKYLLFEFTNGCLIIHLGMSGTLKLVRATTPLLKHDHLDFVFDDDLILRYNDPRRFGAILWTENPIDEHPQIKHLGPEPLSDLFTAQYLYQKLKTRKTMIKTALMDSKIVVGVGNIYASEALFLAKIHPLKIAADLSFDELAKLVFAVQEVLKKAIAAGGTTIKNFMNLEGKPGYFVQKLQVYGRGNQPCNLCGTAIKQIKIAQRSSFFCSSCQSIQTG